jgi:hypothetical protein
MRLRFLVLVLASLPASSLRVAAQPSISADLLNRLERSPARVLIQVAASALPEGRLPRADDVQRQRARLATVQDRVRRLLDRPSNARALRTVPWIAATVTRSELQRLLRDPDVIAVHRDVLMKPTLVESTATIHAPPVWSYGYTGTGWSVALLDSGVDSHHPFLADRVAEQACFSSTVPADSATSLCPGGASESMSPGSGEPCSVQGCGHGTHVAGVAAGRDVAVSGVAPSARVISVQVYSRIDSPSSCSPDPSPCILSYVSDLARALEHVIDLAGPANERRIAAANLSLSFGVFPSACDSSDGMPALKAAVDHLRSLGIATIAASGNDGATNGLGAPACVSSVVSVGSTFDGIDVIVSSSNRSAALSLVAPGSNITTSIPGGAFGTFNGTSLAAPHVAGAWAVLKQLVPAASVSAILSAMRATAVQVFDFAGTYFRLDLGLTALLLNGGVPGPPGPPRQPAVSVSGNVVTLQWTPPAAGLATSYIVAAGSQPGAADLGVFDVGPVVSVSAQVFSPNDVPQTYWVRVIALNPSGQSPATADVPFTVPPPAPPPVPTGLAAVVSGTSVTLTWQTPAGGSVPVAHLVEAGGAPGLADLGVFDTGSPQTFAVFNGVPAGTYYVRVRSRTAMATSVASAEIIVIVN